MTVVGFVLVVLGWLGLLAGFAGFLTDRLNPDTVRRYVWPVAAVAIAAPLLLILSALISDIRRVPDMVGAALLASGILILLFAAASPPLRRLRAGSSLSTWTFVSAAIAGLVLLSIVLLAFVVADLLSLLIFYGFAFFFLGLAAAIASTVWLLVGLIGRRGRFVSGSFLWSAVAFALLGLVGVLILAPRPPSAPDSLSSAAEVDEFLEDLVESNSPPSIAVVVAKDGESVYEEAFGLADGPNSIPATNDTVYHWYSVTKIVTAVAVMQLVEQGLIGLDDPVSDHLSFFQPEYPSDSSERATIADLLNHSSGLPNNVPAVIGWLHLEDDPALDQSDFLRDKLPSYDKLQFDPGRESVYTNVGYYTLAGVIEQVTGQSYEAYVVEHILDPLGMSNTRFEYTSAMRANEGVGSHPLADIQTVFVPLMDLPWPYDYIRDYDDGWIQFERFLFDGNAPSGLIGPAREMARFAMAILNGGELLGQRILSEASVQTMLYERQVEPGSSPEADEYSDFDEMINGIGWFVVRDGGRLHHSHTGGGPGFAASLRLYPEEGLAIAILANGTNLEYHDISDAIADVDW